MSDHTKEEKDHNEITCAFCGKTPSEAAAMIAGPNGIHICNECISVCADVMMREMGIPAMPDFLDCL